MVTIFVTGLCLDRSEPGLLSFIPPIAPNEGRVFFEDLFFFSENHGKIALSLPTEVRERDRLRPRKHVGRYVLV